MPAQGLLRPMEGSFRQTEVLCQSERVSVGLKGPLSDLYKGPFLWPIPSKSKQETLGPKKGPFRFYIEGGSFQAHKGPPKADKVPSEALKWPPGQHKALSSRRKTLLDRKIALQSRQ